MGKVFNKYDENGKRICPMCTSPIDEEYSLEYCDVCIWAIDEAELEEYE